MSPSTIYVISVYRDLEKECETFEFTSLDKVREIIDDCFKKGYGYIVDKRTSIRIAYYMPLIVQKKNINDGE